MQNENANTIPTVATTSPAVSAAPKKPANKKAQKSKAKPAAKAKVLHASSVNNPVQMVHKFLAKNGKNLSRGEALAKLDEKGIAYYTVRTQYQRWFADPVGSAKKYSKAG